MERQQHQALGPSESFLLPVAPYFCSFFDCNYGDCELLPRTLCAPSCFLTSPRHLPQMTPFALQTRGPSQVCPPQGLFVLKLQVPMSVREKIALEKDSR